VIDLECLDASLDLALTDEVRAHQRATTGAPDVPLAPVDTVWANLDSEQHGRAVVDLVRQARLPEADLHIAAHADLARAGSRLGPRADAVGWTVMRALLDGREGAARAGIDQAQALDAPGPDGEHGERLWSQRLAVALTWGDEDERYEILDHSRERAYGHGDLAWHGRLALLLAVLGRAGEARREFDSVIATVLNGPTGDPGWLDRATDLAEAAWVLGDRARSRLADQSLRVTTPPVAVIGRAWVCKGSVARYRALASASAGRLDDGDRYFRSAAEAHRHLGADVLLARTLREWGASLTGRDPQRSVHLVHQGTELGHRLGLVDDGPVVHPVAAQAC